MPKEKNARKLRLARHLRVRRKVVGTAQRPRLCVFRSIRDIYVQVVDDTKGTTLTSASSREPEIRSVGKLPKTDISKLVGAAVAERARNLGTTTVVFDRGGYLYHGRVKALAEGAREGGLIF